MPALEKTTEKIQKTSKGALSLSLDSDHISVEPGSGIAVQVSVENQGSAVDQVLLSVEGVSASWVKTPAFPISLMPGEVKEATLFFNLPRSAEVRSGQFLLTVFAKGQQTRSVSKASISLTVAGFTSFESSLSPTHLRSGQTGRLTIRNNGNASERFTVIWHDPNRVLTFSPAQPAFTIPDNGEAVVEFQAEPGQKNFFGSEKRYPFTAQVHPTSGNPQYHDAEVVSKGAIPSSMIPLMIIMCLGIGVLGMVAGSSLGLFSLQPTQSNTSEQTEIALAVQKTNEAGTATAYSLLDATQASQAIASATAGWLISDDDKDGLSNEQELSFNTLPNKRDTDEDGIDDGEEINQRKTDPLKPDSDGDGLRDGEELARGMDPLSADSDGDGIPDSQDLAPLQTSTSTVDAGATQNSANLATQQAAASQTASANLATSSAAAQLTLSAVHTANAAHAATLTAQAVERIAILYSTDLAAANDFKSFLQAQEYSVELIKLDDINSTDLSIFRIILIGPDTGSTSNWGDGGGLKRWRFNLLVNLYSGSEKAGTLSLESLGWQLVGGTAHMASEEDVLVIDPGAVYWNSPIHVNIPGDQVISLYSNPGDYVGIYMPGPIADVEQIAHIPGNQDYYPLVREFERYTLWGFSGTPSAMTVKGQRIFIKFHRGTDTLNRFIFTWSIIHEYSRIPNPAGGQYAGHHRSNY